MEICTHCGSEFDPKNAKPVPPLVDNQCFSCGTVLSKEKAAELANAMAKLISSEFGEK